MPPTASLTDVPVVSFVPTFDGVLGSDEAEGDEGVDLIKDVGTLESDDLAERAMDLRLLVSGSLGMELGPFVVVALDVDVIVEDEGRPEPFRNDSPDGLPFVYGSDVEDVADIGDNNSGVEESVLVSRLASSSFLTAPI